MLPILVIALFTPLARLLMPAVAAKATRAIIVIYSTIPWPASSLWRRLRQSRIRFFIPFLVWWWSQTRLSPHRGKEAGILLTVSCKAGRVNAVTCRQNIAHKRWNGFYLLRLQLERQNRRWAPAKSRVVVRENQAGDIYRGQSLHFRELSAAATALSEGRGAAPSPAPPSPKPTPTAARPHHSPAANHPWRQGWQNMKIPPSLTHGNQATFVLWRRSGHF